jgi:two-component system, response regulator
MASLLEILLVGGNPQDTELIMQSLQKFHIANHLVHFKNGQQALGFILARGEHARRAGDENPGLILLDPDVPEAGGLDLLKAIKANPRTSSIPVVIISASEEGRNFEEIQKLGVNGYVLKPMEFENFARVIADLGMSWSLTAQPPR